MNSLIDLSSIPEIEENPYHPMNDQFNRELKHVQEMVMATQRQMKPQQVQAVKMKFRGQTNIKIGEALKLSPSTVGKYINSELGQRLINLLKYLDSAMLGPSASHRIAMLYRIAKRNEEESPKVAIAAIAELNKMDMNEHTKNSEVIPTTTTIIINNEQLPRTPLDG